MAMDDSNEYKIWGIDNVVYGPVELPTLAGWVKEERVTSDTWIYHRDRDRWTKAAEIPELQMFFREGAAERPVAGYDTELMAKAPALKPGSLRRIKIFAGLSDEQLGRFVHYMEGMQVRQFTEIVRQGEPGDAMYLILQGEVRVRLMIGGKESILTTLASGEFFGEISLYDQGPRSADVVANVESVLLKISAARFQKLVNEAPDLAAPFLFAMGRTLTGRIRADNKRFRDSVAFARTVH